MVFFRLTYLLRLWEIFICFWSQYLIRLGLTTIKLVAFLFLLERLISEAARGVGISKVSYLTSITVSSGGPLSASSVGRFLSCLRCLLWVNCGPFIIYIMFPTLFFFFFRSFPSPQKICCLWRFWKRLSLELCHFGGTMHVLPGFVRFGNSLS